MSATLYNYVLSGNCYKVRLLASLLNTELNTIAVDFHPGREHKSEAMLQLNPAGTLPILTVDNHVFTETQAILFWLAKKFDKSQTWYPGDSTEQVLAMQWLSFSGRLTVTVGELRLHTMLNKDINVQAAQTGAIACLRELESHLSEQAIQGIDFLISDNPTIADIACFAYTALSPDAGLEHDDYPAIRNWLHRVRSLDGFITMPGIHELHGNVVEQAS